MISALISINSSNGSLHRKKLRFSSHGKRWIDFFDSANYNTDIHFTYDDSGGVTLAGQKAFVEAFDLRIFD